MTPLTCVEICFPEAAPLVEDITLDGPCLTTQMYPLARRDLKCADCGALMDIRTSKKFKAPFYGCSTFPACRGTHGAFPDGRPLGKPANKEAKKARVQAHKVFDLIWREKHKPRAAAYTWMRKRMGLSKEEAHIGLFDRLQCEALIALVKKEFPSTRNAWDRILSFDEDDDPFGIDEEPH